MLISNLPAKYQIPWANSAGAGYIRTVPVFSPGTPGAASFDQGFPPPNFTQIASGGVPPFGQDFNGLMSVVTQWQRFIQAGAVVCAYDATFQTQISGYPATALVASGTLGNGRYYISSTDNNVTDPDTGGAGWIRFPDVLIQQQKPNYVVDAGGVNALSVTLDPLPTAESTLIGAPIRIKVAHTSTITNPTVTFVTAAGSTSLTIINSDGTALSVGQLVAGRVAEGIPCDDGNFQLNFPVKGAGGGGGVPTGGVIAWPNETVPSWALECNGATLNIADQPNLYAVLGTRYGGDGVTTFKLPDYRGEFLRGWDHGRGLDPNAATRTNAGGGLTGDHVGTNEGNAVGNYSSSCSFSNLQVSYQHPASPTTTTVEPFFGSLLGGDDDGLHIATGSAFDDQFMWISKAFTATVQFGGPETRPVNINVMWIIAK